MIHLISTKISAQSHTWSFYLLRGFSFYELFDRCVDKCEHGWSKNKK